MNPAATVRDLLERAVSELRRRGIEEARLDAELLLGHALGTDRVGVIRRLLDPVDQAAATAFRELLDRRLDRVPVAYLLGEREFRGLALEVGAGVLVPRPETEELVELALEMAGDGASRIEVLELGTGSGCIALALAIARPTMQVVALEASARAMSYARRNLRRHRASIQDGQGGRSDPGGETDQGVRVRLVRADFLSADRIFPAGSFDLIVSNPPYVDSPAAGFEAELAHEPELALVGTAGPFPAIYARMLELGQALLRPGGWLVAEVGVDQRGVIDDLVADQGPTGGVFGAPRWRSDLAGIPRAFAVRRNGM